MKSQKKEYIIILTRVTSQPKLERIFYYHFLNSAILLVYSLRSMMALFRRMRRCQIGNMDWLRRSNEVSSPAINSSEGTGLERLLDNRAPGFDPRWFKHPWCGVGNWYLVNSETLKWSPSKNRLKYKS